MKNRQMLFLYNPHAGRGSFKNHLSDVLDLFVGAGYDVVVRPVQHDREHDLYETVKDFTYPYDIVGCCGGDGTINGVVAGMIARNDRIPIGYIPAGTVNDFASSLKIPKNSMRAAKQIVEGFPFPCDVGRHNDKNFIYVAAFGMFTDVSYQTAQSLKNMFGHAAYVLEGVKRLAKIPKYHVKVTYDDNNVIEDDFVLGMVTNSKSVGGFRSLIGSKVLFDDGKFEVSLVKYPKDLIELSDLTTSLVAGKMSADNVYQFRASKIKFESDKKISWTRDGEFGGSFKKVEVENLHRAVKIMVNQDIIKSISESPTGPRLPNPNKGE